MAAISVNKEVREARSKFEDEFNYFSKMETMIHRFPAALGSELSGRDGRYPHMVAPTFVAIGPYHHGKDHLKKMEEVKSAAAYYLCQRMEVEPQAAKNAVLAVADEARSKYYYYPDDAVPVVGAGDEQDEEEGNNKAANKAEASFAGMMFRDACFLLLYMDAYNRSHSSKEDGVVSMSMRRFLFCNRERINSDIMLLENQIPWLVIKALLDLAGSQSQSQKHRHDLYQAVATFIAGLSNSFKITESRDDDLSSASAPHVVLELELDYEKNKNNAPAHLLDLLRRHKTESVSSVPVASEAAANDTNTGNHLHHLPAADAPPPSTDLHHPLILPTSAPRHHAPPSKVKVSVSISSMSPENLQEIGIKLTASKTAAFSDMHLKESLVHGRLTLAPLSLSDTRASWLVNMAALEVCTESSFRDHANRTAVCSYLALLAFFMVTPDDVRRLRSMSLLHGRPHADADMLAFFDAVTKHLPVGRHFAILMGDIAKYKKMRPIRTTLYRWIYNNYKAIMAVVSIILTLISLYQALCNLIPTK